MLNNTKVIDKTEKKDKNLSKEKILYSFGAIGLALFFAFFALLFAGFSPIEYFGEIFKANFGGMDEFGNFLGTLAWVIPIGLAMVVSFKVGVFNIGSAGQMMFSGFIAYWLASFIGASMGAFGIIVLMLSAILSGMAISSFVAILKVKYKVNEVITSIMLNWILLFIIVATDKAELLPQYIDPSLHLSKDWVFSSISERANIGILLAPILIIGLILLYSKTNFGFKQGIVGSNPTVADAIGVSKNSEYVKALALSGALAGIAGWIFWTGTSDYIPEIGVQLDAMYYQGIIVALIGFNSFIGTILSATLIAFFINGEALGETFTNSLPTTDLIMAMMLIFITISHFFIIYRPNYIRRLKLWMNKDDKEEEVKKC